MPQDSQNYGQQSNQPRNVPGQNPGQKPPQNPGQRPGQNPGQNPGGKPGQKPGQYPGQGKPQGFAEQKGEITWTNDEIETLKQLAQESTPIDTISMELGKSEDVIEAKARELNLTLA